MSQRNIALSHFEEACAYKRSIHALELRSKSYSSLPPEQVAQRRAIIAIACKLLEDEISQLIPLGITTWQNAHDPSLPPDAEL
jgi:hypothetical protein